MKNRKEVYVVAFLAFLVLVAGASHRWFFWPTRQATDKPTIPALDSLENKQAPAPTDLIERETGDAVHYLPGADPEFARLDCSKRSGNFEECASACDDGTAEICSEVCRMRCILGVNQNFESQEIGISISLPKGFVRQSEKPLSFVMYGDSQASSTEFFDGISIIFDRQPRRGAAMQALADLEFQEAANVAEILSPLSRIELAGMTAWSFGANESGEMNYFFLPIGDDYLKISVMSPDPQRRGYAAMASDALANLRLLNK